MFTSWKESSDDGREMVRQPFPVKLLRSFVWLCCRIKRGLELDFSSTGYKQMMISVVRKLKTGDGIFGVLTLEGNPFTCFTVENLLKAMEPGTYQMEFNYSPKFNRTMPHILDRVRDDMAGGDAGLRIHWANYPNQLDGCIAVGDKEEPDAIDNSITTFNRLYGIINKMDDLKITISESYV